MNKKVMLIAAGALAVGSTTAVPLARAQGAAPAAAPAVVTAPPTVQAMSAAESLTYWTPERMAAAKPVSFNLAGGGAAAPATAPVASGAPMAVDSEGKVAALPQAGGAGVGATSFSYPFPYQRFQTPASQVRTPPLRQNGKIFFTNNGNNYVCSGTSVATGSRRRVWTAGHCLANTDGAHQWNTSTVFVPGYSATAANPAPFGQWVADPATLTTTTSWLDSCACNVAAFASDLGAFTVTPLGGKNLGTVVGMAGFAWNQASNQVFMSYGWPAAAPFDGGSLQQCIGATSVRDSAGSPNPTGIGCDMTGGSSGGAWVIGYTGTTMGFINGHNDYKYNSQPLAMYSPYFDGLANSVRCSGQPAGFGC